MILVTGLANSAAGFTGWKLSSSSRVKRSGLKTGSARGVMVDENCVATSSGIEGVLVMDGVLVIVGVRLIVGVRVIVGVGVTVGDGGKI